MASPTTMRAWQYKSITNGFENSLKLVDEVPVPSPKPDQHLVKIHSVSLNPVDYKPAENPVFRRTAIPNPATPGIDFSGTIVRPARGSPLKEGHRVFGCGPSPFAGGCLAEYAVTPIEGTVIIPDGVSFRDASTIGVAGLTAIQSIEPYVSRSGGSRVFLNGGSGGVGIFGIQIAKALGCEVTVTCSGRNVDFCRSIGADEVIDYTKHKNLPQAIVESCKGNQFNHVVDNVGAGPELYWGAHRFSQPDSKFIVVGGGASLNFFWSQLKMKLVPGWLGGGKRKLLGFFAKSDAPMLTQIANWMATGKVKPVIDEEFAFEDAPRAFAKLKTNRARGKIVIGVSQDA